MFGIYDKLLPFRMHQHILSEKVIYQEFLHMATLNGKAYIEALHSNLQRELIDRFEIESFFNGERKSQTLVVESPGSRSRTEKL
jgi:hypothetical protein